MKLKTLIVDDEPAGRDCLHDLLAKHDDVELVGECADVSTALAALRGCGRVPVATSCRQVARPRRRYSGLISSVSQMFS